MIQCIEFNLAAREAASLYICNLGDSWPVDLLTWQLIFDWKEVTVLISGCHCGQSPALLLTYYPESIVVSIFATVTSKQLILWRVSWLAPFQSSSRASASYQRSLARRMWRCQCVKELHCKLCFMFAIGIVSVTSLQSHLKLDPVDSTVRYEVVKLCTGSVKDNNNGWYLVELITFVTIIAN